MSTLFTTRYAEPIKDSDEDEMTLEERSKVPTAPSKQVLVQIESGLDLPKIDPSGTLFKNNRL